MCKLRQGNDVNHHYQNRDHEGMCEETQGKLNGEI